MQKKNAFISIKILLPLVLISMAVRYYITVHPISLKRVLLLSGFAGSMSASERIIERDIICVNGEWIRDPDFQCFPGDIIDYRRPEVTVIYTTPSFCKCPVKVSRSIIIIYLIYAILVVIYFLLIDCLESLGLKSALLDDLVCQTGFTDNIVDSGQIIESCLVSVNGIRLCGPYTQCFTWDVRIIKVLWLNITVIHQIPIPPRAFYYERLLNYITFNRMRLRDLIFRSGLADTMSASRQFIRHGFVYVNKRIIRRPNYRCFPDQRVFMHVSKKAVIHHIPDRSYSKKTLAVLLGLLFIFYLTNCWLVSRY